LLLWGQYGPRERTKNFHKFRRKYLYPHSEPGYYTVGMVLKSLQKSAGAHQIMMCAMSQTGVWDGGVGKKKKLQK